MPRPRKHDPVALLDRATRYFWQHGYRSSTSAELAAACGVHEPTLNNAFGNKSKLYRQCLATYTDMGAQAREAAAKEASPLDRIAALLRTIAGMITSPDLPGGCLMTNSIAEIRSLDEEIAEAVREATAEFLHCFEAWFAEAKQSGELSPDFDPKAATSFLAAQIYGWGLLIHIAPERVQESLQSSLDWLQQQRLR